MRLDWQSPYRYMFRDPGWKGKIFVGGLYLLLLPPVGWPIALGYRKAALFALVEGPAPLLPVWPGRIGPFYTDGIKAVGVILVYFLPFLATFLLAGIPDARTVRAHTAELGLLIAGILLLVPVALPLLPPLYWYLFDWIHLSRAAMVGVGALFWATTFLMPAAFLQVSLNGRFAAAFRIDRVLTFVGRNPRTYLEAWAISVIATAIACVLTVAAALGIFWSYLVIVYTFNDALFQSGTPEVRQRFRHSVFAAREAAGPPSESAAGSPARSPVR